MSQKYDNFSLAPLIYDLREMYNFAVFAFFPISIETLILLCILFDNTQEFE